MKFLTLLFCLALVPAVGQTAKVIALDPTDTRKIKDLTAARDAADKALSDYKEEIRKKYAEDEYEHADYGITYATPISSSSMISVPFSSDSWCEARPDKNGVLRTYCKPECPAQPVKEKPAPPEPPKKMVKDWKPKPGWETGIVFSDDYRFIVPSEALPKSSSSPWIFASPAAY